jgi:hypothetical protein
VVAVPPSDDDVEEAPPLPEPLGPLREFTPPEWQRIRNTQRFVQNASRRRTLSASFINGMIWVETGFEARARGRRGPRGMLQLMPRTGRAMARKLNRKYMPESADFSIAAGTEYVMVMYERFDRDLQLALAAYNAGPAVVMAWQEAGSPAPKPRQSYFSRVERAAQAFCERLPQPRYEPDDSPFRCATQGPQVMRRARGAGLAYAPSPVAVPGRAHGQSNQDADRRQRGDVPAAGRVGRAARDVAWALAAGRL